MECSIFSLFHISFRVSSSSSSHIVTVVAVVDHDDIFRLSFSTRIWNSCSLSFGDELVMMVD